MKPFTWKQFFYLLCLSLLILGTITVTLSFLRQKDAASSLPASIETDNAGGVANTGSTTKRVGTENTVRAGNTNGQNDLIISRNAPVFASSENYPATYGNDTSYDTTWRSAGTPAWLAYDLSSLPASARQKALVVWYNETFEYDHTLTNENAYNLPRDYTIEVNAAPGKSNPPEMGWVPVVTVKDNHYHSRQHIINLAGGNWIRINVTAVDGTTQNMDADLNMDVYNAAYGTQDDYIFFGDSITAGTLNHLTINGVKSLGQLINARLSNHLPIVEDGGIGYQPSSTGVKYISTWLSTFPGHYVGVSYGTLDAIGCVNPNTFYQNETFLVKAILTAGKIPLIPHISWAPRQTVQQCGPLINAKIDQLYANVPQIIHGPDFWTTFKNHPELFADGLHPNDQGSALYRQAWAQVLLRAIYHQD